MKQVTLCCHLILLKLQAFCFCTCANEMNNKITNEYSDKTNIRFSPTFNVEVYLHIVYACDFVYMYIHKEARLIIECGMKRIPTWSTLLQRLLSHELMYVLVLF